MESLYLLIESEKIILKCEGVCDLYGGSGACNRKLVNPKKQLACFGNTYYEYMPLRKLKRGRF